MDLDFDFHTGRPEQRFEYKPVSWSFGLDTLDPVATTAFEESLWGVYLLTPRFPQKSVVVFRQKARNTIPPDHEDPYLRTVAWDPDRNQMPPMATYEPDVAALRVMEDWIRSMGTGPSPVNARKTPAQGVPAFRGHSLVLPPGLAVGRALVSLRDLRGREVPMRRIGPLEYALPESAPRGVYLLQTGSKSFTVTPW